MTEPAKVSVETALAYLQESKPAHELLLGHSDFITLIGELNRKGYRMDRVFCYWTAEQVWLVTSESPSTYIYTEVDVRSSPRSEVVAALKGASIQQRGSVESPRSLFSEFLIEASVPNVRWRRRLVVLMVAWGPPVCTWWLPLNGLAAIASMVLDGLALFVTVFVALGFERFTREGVRFPLATLEGMYRSDRYVTVLAACGISSAMLGAVIAAMELAPKPEFMPQLLVTYGPWCQLILARLFVSLSIASLLLCLLGLVTKYLDRTWMKVETEASKAEHQRWKEWLMRSSAASQEEEDDPNGL